MTLYEYKMLSEDEQYDTVFAKGKFLDIVIEGNSKFVLYARDKFFVEVIWILKRMRLLAKERSKKAIAWIGTAMFLRSCEINPTLFQLIKEYS